MPKITEKQISDMNKKLSGGFTFDLWYFMTHGEKTVTMRKPINDKCNAVLHLMWEEEFTKEGAYPHHTGMVYPIVHVSKEFPQNGMAVSYGLGQFVRIGTETYKRRSFKVLAEISKNHDFTEELRLAGFEPESVEESKPLFG